MKRLCLQADLSWTGERVDKFLAEVMEDYSRSFLQKQFKEGNITVNGKPAKASQKVTTIDAKWNTYYQSRQIEIAEDDSLLQIVADYQLTKQNLLDSIAIQKHFFDAQKDFADAELTPDRLLT